MKSALKELSAAIIKLALIEQQQAHAMKAQERAFEAIAKIENRVAAIEQRLPEVTRTSGWTVACGPPPLPLACTRPNALG